jgi:hypothetical protein
MHKINHLVALFTVLGLLSSPLLAAEGGEGEQSKRWFDRITFSGLVEVEAGFVHGFGGVKESDVVLATVELGFDAEISDWVNAHVLLLHEDDDTEPIEVDEAIITIGNTEKKPVYFAGGRMYVPFGTFETNLISDPLTLEIGETREAALQVGFELKGFYGSLYAFNGDTKEAKTGPDDEIEGFGINFGYASANEDRSLDVGVEYINTLGDSDVIQDALPAPDSLADFVPGVGAHVIFHTGPWTFIGEYIAASDSFTAAELPFGAAGAEPKASNLEGGYTFDLAGRESTVAFAYQTTDEALALELPETRALVGLSVGIMDNTTLSFEWAHDEDYDVSDGGTGDDADIITVQLAVEF